MKTVLLAILAATKVHFPSAYYVAYDTFGTRITASENCQYVTEKAKAVDPNGYRVIMYEQKPFRKCKEE